MNEGSQNSKKIPARGLSAACGALLWFVIIQFAVSFFTSEVTAFYAISQFTGGSYADLMNDIIDISDSDLYTALTGILIYIVVTIWAGSRYQKEIFAPSVKTYGSFRERLSQTNPALVALAIVIAIVGFMYLVQYGFQAMYKLAPNLVLAYEDKIEAQNLGTYSAAMIIYTVIMAPVAEELAFRGLIMGLLEKDMNFWVANAIQAFLFAFVHADLVQGMYTFCLGFLFGYIYHKTQNIIFPMLGHLTFNLVGVYLVDYMYFGDTPITSFALIFGSLAALYVGYLLLGRFSWVQARNSQT